MRSVRGRGRDGQWRQKAEILGLVPGVGLGRAPGADAPQVAVHDDKLSVEQLIGKPELFQAGLARAIGRVGPTAGLPEDARLVCEDIFGQQQR